MAPHSTALGHARYASLRTFRLDGTWVETPIWFAREEDHLYVRTGLMTAKVKRIRQTPGVELRPSDYKGRYDTATMPSLGKAIICDPVEQRHGESLLKARYGWQWNIIPMIPLRGLSNPHPELTIRERIEWARSTDPWPGTCILRIDLLDKEAAQ